MSKTAAVAPLKLYIKDVFIIGTVGFLGGIFSSIIGTGIHFIVFSIATTFYKLDEKVATPTSVMIMAMDSICGFFLRGVVIHQFSPQAFSY